MTCMIANGTRNCYHILISFHSFIWIIDIKSYNREAYFELMEFISRTSLNDAEVFCKKLIRESPRLKGLGKSSLTAHCFNLLDPFMNSV